MVLHSYFPVVVCSILIMRKFVTSFSTTAEEIKDVDCPNFVWYGPQYYTILAYIDLFETGTAEGTLDHKNPVILWWTEFTREQGILKKCGKNKCFFTNDRKYKEQTQAFLFYGTFFESWDLPLPRKSSHTWALFHEESPKNKYILSHKETMELFNYTSTFRRESDLPLVTQYLGSIAEIEDSKYMVTSKDKTRYMVEEGLAPVVYVQSDCNTPSDRDHFVQMLARHIKVDSYGRCEHNKDLPPHLFNPLRSMFSEEFYRVLSKYKFIIAFENAVCDDYITEKFWRPFIVGSIPIVFGSPKIKEFLPSNKSAIIVNDYENIGDIVKVIGHLDGNHKEYDSYFEYKKTGVTNFYLKDLMDSRGWNIGNDHSKPDMVTAFECMVCQKVHTNLLDKGLKPQRSHATQDHYGCPFPQRFSDSPGGNLKQIYSDWWATEWLSAKFESQVLHRFIRNGKNFNKEMIEKETNDLLLNYLNINQSYN